MVSENKSELPIIHLTKETLDRSSISWKRTCKEVRKAFEEFGCFMAIHEQYSTEKSNELLNQVKDLFDLPLETKSQLSINGEGDNRPAFTSYIGPNPNMPLYESLSITDSTNHLAVETFSNTLWPSGNSHFCDMAKFYGKTFSTLDQTVGRMVFESYGVDEVKLDEYLESLTYLLVFIKYKAAADENEINLGLIPHTDIGLITVLHQNQVSGLDVKTKDGQWITVHFPPSSVIIIAGDSLQAWSNGRIKPALHKVTMNGKEERYSVAQFGYPTPQKLIYAPQQLVDDDHPRLYKPLDAYGLRRFYRTIDRDQVNDVLKAFCGV